MATPRRPQANMTIRRPSNAAAVGGTGGRRSGPNAVSTSSSPGVTIAGPGIRTPDRPRGAGNLNTSGKGGS